MQDMPYILTDACDATCAGIETVLRNEAARREAGQELPEDIRRQLWDAVRERVREMNPVDGDADQNGEGEGERKRMVIDGEGDGNGMGMGMGMQKEKEMSMKMEIEMEKMKGMRMKTKKARMIAATNKRCTGRC